MGKTALLLLDLQDGIMEHFKDEKASYLARVTEAIKAARAAGISIIYVQTCFRPGHPEISSRNFSFKRVASYGGFIEGDASVAISSQVAPQEHDLVVTKRRVSAFSGSDLDVVLRSLDANNLVLTGVATSGAVLSTLRQGADLDYGVTVLKDLCLDRDQEVHRVLTEKVFPRQAHVLDAEEWIGQIATTE